MRDLKYFLKSLEVSDAIITLEDEYDLSAEEALKLDTFFSSYLVGKPLDYIMNETLSKSVKFEKNLNGVVTEIDDLALEFDIKQLNS